MILWGLLTGLPLLLRVLLIFSLKILFLEHSSLNLLLPNISPGIYASPSQSSPESPNCLLLIHYKIDSLFP